MTIWFPPASWMIQGIFVSVMHLQPNTACLTSTEVMVSAISWWQRPVTLNRETLFSVQTAIQQLTAVLVPSHPVSAIQKWPAFSAQVRCGSKCLRQSKLSLKENFLSMSCPRISSFAWSVISVQTVRLTKHLNLQAARLTICLWQAVWPCPIWPLKPVPNVPYLHRMKKQLNIVMSLSTIIRRALKAMRMPFIWKPSLTVPRISCL